MGRNIKDIFKYCITFMLGAVITAAGIFLFLTVSKKDDLKADLSEADGLVSFSNRIFVGDTELKDYVICAPLSLKDASARLYSYIKVSTGEGLSVVEKKPSGKAIYLIVDKKRSGDLPAITLENGNINIYGGTDSELLKQVDVFANLYLGFSFAGEDREHLLCTGREIFVPDTVYYNGDGPYIEKREPIIVLWNPSFARGAYFNQNTVKKSDILSFSDDRLYDYVKMMKAMGFTGIQATDICAAWAEYGNYEFVHQRLRFMADAAHSLGMDFTLWVWGSEFNGYGWIDTSVEYYNPTDGELFGYKPAVDTYEKYYDIYSELADCSDRLIVHFYEPGHVGGMDQVAKLSLLIRDKFIRINPEINTGINIYSRYFDLSQLSDELGEENKNFTFYTLAMPGADEEFVNLRTVTMLNDLDYGIWSWGVIEREIDQTAEMTVNAREIKSVYKNTATLDHIKKPEYWSEMEAYHNGNIFSLYVASKLLQDPELDPDVLLYEAAEAVVGSGHAKDLYDVLSLIQDARVGEDHGTFYETDENYIFLNGAKDPLKIIEECDAALTKLQNMIDADIHSNTLPLSVSVSDILKMMVPNVHQISEYAEFRLNYGKLTEMAETGKSKEELSLFIESFFKPVCEYNVVTGLWGLE
nr:hypothetical protein [Lachnospiraceae bacterium]